MSFKSEQEGGQKLSDLIKYLQDLKKNKGDLPIHLVNRDYYGAAMERDICTLGEVSQGEDGACYFLTPVHF